jgi:transposase-like protein
MSKPKPLTLRQFLAQFPTEELCLDHIMRQRFGIEHECGSCGREAKFYRVTKRRSYACEWCGYQVFPTSGTPFDRTRTPLRDWFTVMFMFTTTRNGVAAKRVQRELGVTYKTAWRMCHQIREYMGAVDGDEPIGGPFTTVEVDETWIGGEREGMGMGYTGNKMAIVGMAQRGGDVILRPVTNRRRTTLHSLVREHVKPHGTVCTDEFSSYDDLALHGYWHKRVNHAAGQHIGPTGGCTNTVEGVWAALKRGINGTHIHISAKHLPKYLGEFEYRWNMRDVPHLMLSRLMHSFAR